MCLLGCLLVLLYLAIPPGDGGEPYTGLNALLAAGLALVGAGALAITGGIRLLLTGRRNGRLLTRARRSPRPGVDRRGGSLDSDHAATYVLVGIPSALVFVIAAALSWQGSSRGDPSPPTSSSQWA